MWRGSWRPPPPPGWTAGGGARRPSAPLLMHCLPRQALLKGRLAERHEPSRKPTQASLLLPPPPAVQIKACPEVAAALSNASAAVPAVPLLDRLVQRLEPVLRSLRRLARAAERQRTTTQLMLACLAKLVRPPLPAPCCWARPCLPHGPDQGRHCCRMQGPAPGAPGFRIDRYGLAVSPFAILPSPFAWHIDHRLPVACGGATDAGNLEAVQHRFNHCKRDRWGRQRRQRPCAAAQPWGWLWHCVHSPLQPNCMSRHTGASALPHCPLQHHRPAAAQQPHPRPDGATHLRDGSPTAGAGCSAAGRGEHGAGRLLLTRGQGSRRCSAAATLGPLAAPALVCRAGSPRIRTWRPCCDARCHGAAAAAAAAAAAWQRTARQDAWRRADARGRGGVMRRRSPWCGLLPRMSWPPSGAAGGRLPACPTWVPLPWPAAAPAPTLRTAPPGCSHCGRVSWDTVAAEVGSGRSGAQCKEKWRRLLQCPAALEEEDTSEEEEEEEGQRPARGYRVWSEAETDGAAALLGAVGTRLAVDARFGLAARSGEAGSPCRCKADPVQGHTWGTCICCAAGIVSCLAAQPPASAPRPAGNLQCRELYGSPLAERLPGRSRQQVAEKCGGMVEYALKVRGVCFACSAQQRLPSAQQRLPGWPLAPLVPPRAAGVGEVACQPCRPCWPALLDLQWVPACLPAPYTPRLQMARNRAALGQARANRGLTPQQWQHLAPHLLRLAEELPLGAGAASLVASQAARAEVQRFVEDPPREGEPRLPRLRDYWQPPQRAPAPAPASVAAAIAPSAPAGQAQPGAAAAASRAAVAAAPAQPAAAEPAAAATASLLAEGIVDLTLLDSDDEGAQVGSWACCMRVLPARLPQRMHGRAGQPRVQAAFHRHARAGLPLLRPCAAMQANGRQAAPKRRALAAVQLQQQPVPAATGRRPVGCCIRTAPQMPRHRLHAIATLQRLLPAAPCQPKGAPLWLTCSTASCLRRRGSSSASSGCGTAASGSASGGRRSSRTAPCSAGWLVAPRRRRRCAGEAGARDLLAPAGAFAGSTWEMRLPFWHALLQTAIKDMARKWEHAARQQPGSQVTAT